MKAEVYNREIHYDFTNEEVDFLQSLDLWDEVRKKLQDHEVITIEGDGRIVNK